MWTTQGRVFDEGQHASVECFLLTFFFFFKQDIEIFLFYKVAFEQLASSQGARAPHL